MCAAFIRKISDKGGKKGSKQTPRDDKEDKGCKKDHEEMDYK